MRSFLRSTLPLAILTAVALTGCGVGTTLDAGTAFKAKNLGSGVFVSGRSEEAVESSDLAFGPLWIVGSSTDAQAQTATGYFLGMFRNTALYRPGLGSTLVVGTTEQKLREQAHGFDPGPAPDLSQTAWPMGDDTSGTTLSAEVDREKLEHALDLAFTEPGGDAILDTRAVVVVYRDQLIAERYAPGFDLYTPLPSWSMTKSFTSALVGILVGQGKLDIYERAPVPEWDDPEDPRGAITLDQLMRMSSGLKFEEEYFNYGSDVVQMLFNSYDAAALAAEQPLEGEPDTIWHYSSGTSNIVSRIVRQALRGSTADYWMFPRRELMEPLGMYHSTPEPDPSGTFVGSSFMYATPRDWARFGMLYLHDGVWQGERILPEGWVEYGVTPTPLAPQGMYGAHWWLNAGTAGDPEDRRWPDLPPDAYAAMGFEGQLVLVVPSYDLVIVRMGQSRPENVAWKPNDFAREILAAIER